MKKKILIIIVVAAGLICYGRNIYSVIVSNKTGRIESTLKCDMGAEKIREILLSSKDKIIIVDAGHGGKDPGKVGIHNELEKDINLSIAMKLKDRLLEQGFSVIMTRTKDEGLYSEYDRNKKMADLRKRVEIVNSSDALCMVSIHQNSFTSSRERGSQVFYYSTSDLSEGLAKCVQNSLKEKINKDNKREEKSNGSYYLLKKTYKPAVIVECGFLSNGEEATKLSDEKYQGEIARAICEGIINWANGFLY